MSKEEKEIDLARALFDNKTLVNDIFENLKKELLEFIFLDEINTFKKAIFIQGVFSYANLILSANQSMTEEEKNLKIIELVNISKMLNEDIAENIVKYAN